MSKNSSSNRAKRTARTAKSVRGGSASSRGERLRRAKNSPSHSGADSSTSEGGRRDRQRTRKKIEIKSGEETQANKRGLAERKYDRSQDQSSTPAELPIKPYFIEVDAEHAGQRLDNFLFTNLKGVPRSMIYRIIRKGELRINKGRVKQTTRLAEGDSIRIPPLRRSEDSNVVLEGSKYEFLRKATLFEDDAVLVINKPSGMAVHAGSGIKVGVIEALRALRSELNYLELVHRLDRETSGCLVLAKKSGALKQLNADFMHNSLKNPRLDKRYLTLLEGKWHGGERRVTKALDTNARRAGERVVRVSEHGSYASSIFKPLAISNSASLLEVKLLTGRTHQVRVHAQSENHAVAGDQKYGSREFNKKMKNRGLSRLFLHAASITFYHPLTEEKMKVAAPLPKELVSVLTEAGLASEY